MKLPNSFVSEKKLDDKVENLIDADPYHPSALAIAIGFTNRNSWYTDIMVWMPQMEEPEKVTTRFGYVQGLCVYKNLLYDGGENRKITETLNERVVAERKEAISSLVVHDGIMYDGSNGKVFKTDKGKVVAKRAGWVRALCSCNGVLYDGGSYKKVIQTFDNKVIAERGDWVYALGYHDNLLYDATEKGIISTFEKKFITRRKDIPFALFSFENKLYDAGQYSYIYETSSSIFKKKFLRTGFIRTEYGKEYRGVTAVQPISFWLANQLLQKSP